MNTRTALIALLVALALAAVAWLLIKPATKPAPPPRTWLATLDPLQVVALSVTLPDGQNASIERSPVPDTWVLIQHPSKGPQPPAWPVGSVQIRIALRLIADLEAVAPAEAAAPTASTTVTIKFRDGSEHQLTLSEMSLGGKTLVKVHGPPDSFRLGQANLSQMFQEGLRAWRSRGAIATVSQESETPHDLSRIRLETVGRQITLGQVNGKWGVQAPVAAPADPSACAKLLQTLASISIARFADDPLPDSATGLAAPSAMIETESDFRIPSGPDITRRVLKQRLTLGGPTDPTGKLLYASIRADWKDPAKGTQEAAWGPILVMVNRADVSALSADLAPYVSRQATLSPVADIKGLTLVPSDAALTEAPAPDPAKPQASPSRAVRLTRTLDGWRYKPDQGELRTPTSTALAAIDSAIHLISESPADAVGLEPPTGSSSVCTLTIEAGGPPQLVGIGVAQVTPAPSAANPAPKPQPALIIRTGPMFRVYMGKAALDMARWLSEELPPEG